MLSKTIPGTNIEYRNNKEASQVIEEMIEITGGLSLSQICKITNLQTSTIQNWVKRKYVPRPDHKKYYERHISRILLISALRECMNIEDIGELMSMINGDTDDETDDIISETRLYDYFCKAISKLDLMSLNDEQISKTIIDLLKDETVYKERLVCGLKVMVYAYISGRCLNEINNNLNKLKIYQEVR